MHGFHAVSYKFSPQQITGINYYYSKIAAGTFDEDDVRLLLIHLREFLRNRDNKGAAGRANALFLREAGDNVAHTIRDQGLLHDRLLEFLPDIAGPARALGRVPHPLFDLNKLVDALKDALEDCGVLYAPTALREVIARESLDIKICLISLLNGMVLRFEYPTIRDDFVFFSPEAKPVVYIRTEVDPSEGIRELRLNAALPYTGGKFNACVVFCVVEDKSKIEQAVMNRTGSADGYCEPIRTLRRNGILRLCVVPTGVSSIHLHDVRRAMAYDTNPYPKNAGLVLPPGFEAWVTGGPPPSSQWPNR